MTFREKLQMEHPECIGNQYDGGCKGCPNDYGYEEESNKDCFKKSCAECWDRVIPGTETAKKSVEQLLEEHFSERNEPLPEYIPANPQKTTGSILLECAKTIAYVCKQNQNCDNCVFLDNDNACVLAPNGDLFPEGWMIPIATLEDLEK